MLLAILLWAALSNKAKLEVIILNIGIIGSGNMGSSLGKIWANNGHKVMFSYSRDWGKLKALAESIGSNAQIGTPAEAVQFARVVLLAVPWSAIDDALQATGSLEDKVLISCVSPFKPDFEGKTVGITSNLNTSGAEEIAKRVPKAKVVEAFNTTFAEILRAPSRYFGQEQASIFYCGDDEEAKVIAFSLIQECGFTAVDAGPLLNARSLEPLATIWVQLGAVTGMFPNAGLKVLRR